MKIYTKSVWQWIDDQLVRVDAECKSFDHSGPVDLLKGGGGGGDQYYENLNKLYGLQADLAETTGGVFKKEVVPRYQELGHLADESGSIAKQEAAATRAMADVRGSTSAQQQMYEQDQASRGIDTSLPEYAAARMQAGITGAGMEAGAGTNAREREEQKHFAMLQDVVGLGMGTPTSATSAANSAANAANSGWQNENAYNAQMAQGIGSAARLGTNIYGISQGGSGTTMAADGGYISKKPFLRLKQGGYVQRLAMGGPATGGFARSAQFTPPPARAPLPPTTTEQLGSVAATPMGAQGIRMGVGKAAEMGGSAAGSPGVSAFGTGTELGWTKAKPAIDAYNSAAAAQVDANLGLQSTAAEAQLGTEAATATAADSEAALAASQVAASEAAAGEAAAAGLAETGAGLTAGAALGTAVPVIGAGLATYAIGSQLGWWADGGSVEKQGLSRGGGVTPGSVQDTGEVDGPGGPKDDLIDAKLSDGEYVMPIGAVKFYGLDKLDKMRQKGLEYEKQMGIGR